MKWDKVFFRSRVAQRIALLFILCALLPIALLAILSFKQVTKHLHEQSRARLHQTSKAMALSFFERLMFLESDLTRMAANIQASSSNLRYTATPEFDNYLKEKFSSISLLDSKGYSTYILGNIQNLPKVIREGTQSLRQEETIISAQLQPEGMARLFMIKVLESANPDLDYMIAEVKPLYVWLFGFENSLPPMTELCVLDHSDQVLYSSYEGMIHFPEQAKHELNRATSGFFEWTLGEKTYLAGFRDIFLQSRFASEKWRVVVSEAKSHVYAPIAYFKKTFPFVVLLSLWIVLLFSVSQIRRSLVPLEKLKDGAERIAKRDFDSKILVKSRDEFAEVAASFNIMASQLGKQFKTLTAIAEIDRAILSTMNTEKMANTLLSRILQIFPDKGVNLILLDAKKEDLGQAYIAFGNPASQKIVEEIQLTPEDIQSLQDNPHILAIDDDHSTPDYLAPLKKKGFSSFHIFPIFLKHKLAGLISVGSRDLSLLNKDDLNQLRQLSNQVGVAVSNTRLVEEIKEFSWGTLISLARAIDAKSHWTAGHSERVTALALSIGRVMELSNKELDVLHRGGLLHDIGKLGIPNEILDKAEKLSLEDRKILETHPTLGANILEPISAYTEIMLIVKQHHENFDGSGYPEGLMGENISLCSRILAIADRYEALTADRPYRKAIPPDLALQQIKNVSGKEFDPRVVDAFLEVITREEGN